MHTDISGAFLWGKFSSGHLVVRATVLVQSLFPQIHSEALRCDKLAFYVHVYKNVYNALIRRDVVCVSCIGSGNRLCQSKPKKFGFELKSSTGHYDKRYAISAS